MFANNYCPSTVLSFRFSTSADVTMHSVLIHDYYMKKYRDPLTIFLVVDTTLRGGKFNIKAHVR